MNLAPDRTGITRDTGIPHIPVLVEEVVSYLVQGSGGSYIDGTVGAGGHAAALLEAAGPSASLLGIDADPYALALAQQKLSGFTNKVVLVHSNFRHMGDLAFEHGFEKATGIILDLGMSSMQLDSRERGFSFRLQGELDMRFNPAEDVPAAQLLATMKEKEIAVLLREYGEEPKARRIAREIVSRRPIETAADLASAVRAVIPDRLAEDTLARVFQALRIAVNKELENLRYVLGQATDILAPSGRLAVISFHSLEDRMVKQFFRRESASCICPPDVPICVCDHTPRLRVLTRRPIVPSTREIRANSRSRSAKLRVAEKL